MIQSTGPKTLSLSVPKIVSKTFLILIFIELVLVLADIIINYAEVIPYAPVQRIFNIAREDSLANFLGSVQTLIAAAIVWALFAATRLKGWACTAILFTYLGIDDGADIHERVGTAFKMMMVGSGDAHLSFFPSYPWQVIFMPIFGVLGLVMLHTFWNFTKDREIRIWFIAALTCYGVAVVLDFFEGVQGFHVHLSQWFSASFMPVTEYTVRHFSKVFEEFLEMYGTSMFLLCFLQLLMQKLPDIRIQFD
jgi:hypothetical protein